MNKVQLIGRLTADPNIRYSGKDSLCIAKYILAVERRFKKDGDDNADFIRCIAFGKAGEFVEKYLTKGMKIAVCGRIQTGSFKGKDGNIVYTTDVIAEEHYFVETRQRERIDPIPDKAKLDEEFGDFSFMEEADIEHLPFN